MYYAPLVPMMEQSRLEKVLPSCIYSPTYVVRDFPIARYQGLQFVSSTDTPDELELFEIYLVLLMLRIKKKKRFPGIVTISKHCPPLDITDHYNSVFGCFFLFVSVTRSW